MAVSKRTNKFGMRFTALATLLIYIIGLGGASPALASEAVTGAIEFSIPQHLGKIVRSTSSFPLTPALSPEGRGEGEGHRPNKCLILIQNAHEIPSAQRSIRDLIQYLVKDRLIRRIGVEGASARLDASFFKSFPDKNLLRTVLEEKMDQGEISGVSMAAVSDFSGAVYQGIESHSLYEKGLLLYQEAVRNEPRLLRRLQRVKRNHERDKGKNYSKELLDADSVLAQFHDNRMDILAALNQLERYQPPPAGSSLAALLKLQHEDSVKAEKQNLQGAELYGEFESYSEKVMQTLISRLGDRRKQAEDLYETTKRLRLFEKLARLELSSSEWKELKRKNQRATLHGWKSHFDFYKNSEQRDKIFVKKLGRIFKRVDTAAVVTGGFHSESLAAAFEGMGAATVTVMPNIGHISEQTSYRDHMAGNVSWKSYLKSNNGRVNVYEAFIRKMRDELLERAGGNTQELTERWRDQIILNKARGNRLERIPAETVFLDEITGRTLSRLGPFIQGLRALHESGEISEQNISQLFLAQTTETPAGPILFSPGETLPDKLFYRRSELRSAGENQDLVSRGSPEFFFKGTDAAAYAATLEKKPIDPEKLERLFNHIRLKIAAMDSVDDQVNAQRVLDHLTGLAKVPGGSQIYVFDELRWTDGSYYFGNTQRNKIELGYGFFWGEEFSAQMLFIAGMKSLYGPSSDPKVIDGLSEKIFGSEETTHFWEIYQQVKELTDSDALHYAADRFDYFQSKSPYFETFHLIEDWVKYTRLGKLHPAIAQAGFLAKRLWDERPEIENLKGRIRQLVAQGAGSSDSALFSQREKLVEEYNRKVQNVFAVLYPLIAFSTFRSQLFLSVKNSYRHLYEEKREHVQTALNMFRSGEAKLDPRIAAEALSDAGVEETVTKEMLLDWLRTRKLKYDFRETAVLRSPPTESVSETAFEKHRVRLRNLILDLLTSDTQWREKMESLYTNPAAIVVEAVGNIDEDEYRRFADSFSGGKIGNTFTHSALDVLHSGTMLSVAESDEMITPNFRRLVLDGAPVAPMTGMPFPAVYFSHHGARDLLTLQIYRHSVWTDLLYYLHGELNFQKSVADHGAQDFLASLIKMRKKLSPSGVLTENYFAPDGVDMKTWVKNILDLSRRADTAFLIAAKTLYGTYTDFLEQYLQEQEVEPTRRLWYYILFSDKDGILAGIAKELKYKNGGDRLTPESAVLLIDTLMGIYWSGIPRGTRDYGLHFILSRFNSFISIYPDGIGVKDLEAFKKFLTQFNRTEALPQDKGTLEKDFKDWEQKFFELYPEAAEDQKISITGQNNGADPPADSDFAVVYPDEMEDSPFMVPDRIPAGQFLDEKNFGKKDDNKKIIWVGTYQEDGLRIPGTDFKLVIPGMQSGIKLRLVMHKSKLDIEDVSKKSGIPGKVDVEALVAGNIKAEDILSDIVYQVLARLTAEEARAPYGVVGELYGRKWQKVPVFSDVKINELDTDGVISSDGINRLATNGEALVEIPFDLSNLFLEIPLLKGKSTVLVQKYKNKLVFYDEQEKTFIGSLTGSVSDDPQRVKVLSPLSLEVAHLAPKTPEEYRKLNVLAALAKPWMETGRGYERIDLDVQGERAVTLDIQNGIVRISPDWLESPELLSTKLEAALEALDPLYLFQNKVKQWTAFWESEDLFNKQIPLPEIPGTIPDADLSQWRVKEREAYHRLREQFFQLYHNVRLARQMDAYREKHAKELGSRLSKAGLFRNLVKEVLVHGRRFEFVFYTGSDVRYTSYKSLIDFQRPVSGNAKILEGIGIMGAKNFNYVYDRTDAREQGAHFQLALNPEAEGDKRFIFIQYKHTLPVSAGGPMGQNEIGALAVFDLETGELVEGQKFELEEMQKQLAKAREEINTIADARKTKLDLAKVNGMIDAFLIRFHEARQSAAGSRQAIQMVSDEIAIVKFLLMILLNTLDSHRYSPELNYGVMQLLFEDMLRPGQDPLERAEELVKKVGRTTERMVLKTLEEVLFEYAGYFDKAVIDLELLFEPSMDDIQRREFEQALENFLNHTVISAARQDAGWIHEPQIFFQNTIGPAADLGARLRAALEQFPDLASEDGSRWLDISKAKELKFITNGGSSTETTPVQGYFIRGYFENIKKAKAEEAAAAFQLQKKVLSRAEEAAISVTLEDLTDDKGNSLIFQSGETRVLVDTGIAKSGYGQIQNKPKAVLITHAHFDHYSSILDAADYLGPDVPFVMTPVTKDWLYQFLMSPVERQIKRRVQEDFFVGGLTARNGMSGQQLELKRKRIQEFFDQRVIAVDFHTPVKISNELVVQLIPAGHIAGAASVLAITPNGNTLLTGDFSFHDVGPVKGFKGEAQVPVHMMIMDSSMATVDIPGGQEERQNLLVARVQSALQQKSGTVLIDVGGGLTPQILDLLARRFVGRTNFFLFGGPAREIDFYQRKFPQFYRAGPYPRHVIRKNSYAGPEIQSLQLPTTRDIILSSSFDEITEAFIKTMESNPQNTLFVTYGKRNELLDFAEHRGRAGAEVFALNLYSHPLLPEIFDFLEQLSVKPRYFVAIHGSVKAKQTMLQQMRARYPAMHTVTPTGNSISFAPFVEKQNEDSVFDEEGLNQHRAWFGSFVQSSVTLEVLRAKEKIHRSELRRVEYEQRIAGLTAGLLDIQVPQSADVIPDGRRPIRNPEPQESMDSRLKHAGMTALKNSRFVTQAILKIHKTSRMPEFLTALEALGNGVNVSTENARLKRAQDIATAVVKVDHPTLIRYVVSEADLGRMKDARSELRKLTEFVQTLVVSSPNVVVELKLPEAFRRAALKSSRKEAFTAQPAGDAVRISARNRPMTSGLDHPALTIASALEDHTGRWLDALYYADGARIRHMDSSTATGLLVSGLTYLTGAADWLEESHKEDQVVTIRIKNESSFASALSGLENFIAASLKTQSSA